MPTPANNIATPEDLAGRDAPGVRYLQLRPAWSTTDISRVRAGNP